MSNREYGFGVAVRSAHTLIVEFVYETYDEAKKCYDRVREIKPNAEYVMVNISETIPVEELKYLTTLRVIDSDGIKLMQITRLFDNPQDSRDWIGRMDATWHITKALTKDEYSKWLK